MHTVLENAKGPLGLDEIVAGVKADGYRSNSANFKNVVYQCLYTNDEFVSGDTRGTYTLAKAKASKGTAKKKSPAKKKASTKKKATAK